MDKRDILKQFVESMTQLMSVMRREIEILKARDYKKLEEIQRTKTALGKTYDHTQRVLQSDMSIVSMLTEDERSEIRTLYARFREALSENMLALKAAQDATDRAVKMVVDGVKKARGLPMTEPTKPGRPARGYAAYGGGMGTSASFAVNRTT